MSTATNTCGGTDAPCEGIASRGASIRRLCTVPRGSSASCPFLSTPTGFLLTLAPFYAPRTIPHFVWHDGEPYTGDVELYDGMVSHWLYQNTEQETTYPFLLALLVVTGDHLAVADAVTEAVRPPVVRVAVGLPAGA